MQGMKISFLSNIKVIIIFILIQFVKEKKRNNLKDFLNVAGPMGVTHFLMISNPKSIPHLRVARTPQGPTLTFHIQEYALAADIAKSQPRHRCPPELFKNSPLVSLVKLLV
jgi:ribosome biogenesis protein SSF1/2